MDDSNILTTAALTVRLQRYEAGVEQPPHAHATPGISVVLAGSVEERVGAVRRRGEAGAVVRKPAGTIHADRFGAHGAVMLNLGGSLLDGFAEAWTWSRPTAAWRVALAALRAARSGAQAGCEEHLLALLGALGGKALPEATPAALAAVRTAIDRGGPAPAVADLARAIGVHPVSLTRAFRRHHGMSITRYARRGRVARAARLLAASDRRIGEIAAELEFFDQSHLCRAFGAETGLSPSAFRRLLRA